MRNIYCIGGASIDQKLKTHFPLITHTSNPVTSAITFGGVARNIAQNLAQWTTLISLQTVVGRDDLSQQLLNEMASLGVNVKDCLTLANHSTAHYYAIMNNDGNLHLALADMSIYDHIPIDLFTKPWKSWNEQCIIFMDTNLSIPIIESIFLHNKDNRFILCIDPVSVSKAKKLPKILRNTFLIKPNLLEAIALTNININSVSDCFIAAKVLLNRGVKNVVISLGKDGYVIVNEHYQSYFPATKIEYINDVNGAGDAFMAGILFGLQQNYDLQHACQLGANAASLTLKSQQSAACITIAELQAKV